MSTAISTRFQGYSYQPGKPNLFKAWKAERLAAKAVKDRESLYRMADSIIEEMTASTAIRSAHQLRVVLDSISEPAADEFYICAAKARLESLL